MSGGPFIWNAHDHLYSGGPLISSLMRPIVQPPLMQAPQVGRLHEFAIDDVALRGFSHRSQSSRFTAGAAAWRCVVLEGCDEIGDRDHHHAKDD